MASASGLLHSRSGQLHPDLNLSGARDERNSWCLISLYKLSLNENKRQPTSLQFFILYSVSPPGTNVKTKKTVSNQKKKNRQDREKTFKTIPLLGCFSSQDMVAIPDLFPFQQLSPTESWSSVSQQITFSKVIQSLLLWSECAVSRGRQLYLGSDPSVEANISRFYKHLL